MHAAAIPFDALGALGTVARAPTTARFCFRVATDGPRLAFAPGTITELPLDARTCRLPGAPAWISGMLNRHGALYPIFDLAHWCALPLADGQRRVTLLVDTGDEGAGILCDGEPFVLQLPALTPDVDDAPAVLKPYLRGAARLADGPVYEFDHRLWLRDAGAARGPMLSTQEQLP